MAKARPGPTPKLRQDPPQDPPQDPIDEAQFSALRLMLARRKRLEFAVATGSMLPVIPIGASVQVEPLESEPQRFEILVFWNGTLLICHYLWHINQLAPPGAPREYITRALIGGEDLPVTEARVLGRVTSFRIPRPTRFGIVVRSLWRRR